MNSSVVGERAYLLNRFLTDLADRKYFWDSEEVRIFIKPKNNVIAELKILPRPTIEQVLEKVTVEAQINIQISEYEVNEYTEKIK